ncbi:hypothetical protein [uncultured Thiocystis sp.]|jgi:hypothetical protein|uniref:hypothetical protein n=1 Tax=uncultured Thiocystis sp. TaxID=1202134 RepID=UPI0026009987|nr:hypothetical protein [uncultured Thiocystis sp.]
MTTRCENRTEDAPRLLDNRNLANLARRLRESPEVVLAYGCEDQTGADALAVALLGIAPFGQERLLAHRAALVAALGTERLALIDLGTVSPQRQRQILQRGRLLYARECGLVGPFELGVLRACLDAR